MVWLAYAVVILTTILTWFKGPKDASPGWLSVWVFVGGMVAISLLGL